MLHCKDTVPKIGKILRGLSPNFNIHMSVSDLYIPTVGLPIWLQQNSCMDRFMNTEVGKKAVQFGFWGYIIRIFFAVYVVRTCCTPGVEFAVCSTLHYCPLLQHAPSNPGHRKRPLKIKLPTNIEWRSVYFNHHYHSYCTYSLSLSCLLNKTVQTQKNDIENIFFS
jgi:hypothetical protein